MKKVLVISLFLLAGLAIAADKKETQTSSATTTTATKTTSSTSSALVRSFGGFGGETSTGSIRSR